VLSITLHIRILITQSMSTMSSNITYHDIDNTVNVLSISLYVILDDIVDIDFVINIMICSIR
jgi:hypothetical protein